MHLTFLGTAAATALPLPFCRCPVCCQARSLGGKDLRRRSSLLVNGDLLLDLGPDAPSSAAHFGKDLSSLRYLLQTHAHSDHFDAAHLVTRLAEYASRDVSPLAIACSRQTAAAMSAALSREEAGASLLDASWQRRLGISCQIARPGPGIFPRPLPNFAPSFRPRSCRGLAALLPVGWRKSPPLCHG